MVKEIPDKWLDYKPMGTQIDGTRFIAFKVPLREKFLKNVHLNNRMTIEKLSEIVPKLGLVIDLTSTKRYYDPADLKYLNIDYKKLEIPGAVTPKEHYVEKFRRIVSEFLENNKNNDELIGVHCTHGINRTGYLICRFMIDFYKLSPTEAMARFADARGHTIRRENYISKLISCGVHLKGSDIHSGAAADAPETSAATTAFRKVEPYQQSQQCNRSYNHIKDTFKILVIKGNRDDNNQTYPMHHSTEDAHIERNSADCENPSTSNGIIPSSSTSWRSSRPSFVPGNRLNERECLPRRYHRHDRCDQRYQPWSRNFASNERLYNDQSLHSRGNFHAIENWRLRDTSTSNFNAPHNINRPKFEINDHNRSKFDHSRRGFQSRWHRGNNDYRSRTSSDGRYNGDFSTARRN